MKTFTIVLFLFLYMFSFAQSNQLIDRIIVGFDLSPDEQTIVFACPNWERPRPSFAVVDVRSGKIRKLIENGESISFPKFSSDGKRILFEDGYNTLKSIDLKGDDIQTHFKLPYQSVVCAIVLMGRKFILRPILLMRFLKNVECISWILKVVKLVLCRVFYLNIFMGWRFRVETFYFQQV